MLRREVYNASMRNRAAVVAAAPLASLALGCQSEHQRVWDEILSARHELTEALEEHPEHKHGAGLRDRLYSRSGLENARRRLGEGERAIASMDTTLRHLRAMREDYLAHMDQCSRPGVELRYWRRDNPDGVPAMLAR